MNLEDNIKEWSKIIESQINEVSDIDVDWDDETLNNKEIDDFVKAAEQYQKLDIADLGYLASIYEDCLDMDKIE